MAVFHYTGRNTEGRMVRGAYESSTEAEALKSLQAQGIFVTRIVDTSSKTAPRKKIKRHKKIRTEDQLFFIREMAVLLEAGVPAMRALELIAEQIRSEKLFKILTQIKADVHSGMALKDSFEKHPKDFPPVWISLIEAGETSGHLSQVLHQLANHLEASIHLRKKITSALIYPSVLIAVSIGAILIFMLKIIPIFAKLFGQFKASLPPLTQGVVNMSNFTKSYFIHMIVGVVILVFGYRQFAASHRGRWIVDRLKLNLPVIGNFNRDSIVARVSINLSTLLESGVDILKTLDIASSTAGNVVYEEAIANISHKIRQGKTLSAAFEENALFPPFLVQMAVIGEEGGELPKMMQRAAKYYSERVDIFVARLGTIIEPLILLLVGGIVGVLVIAMFMPIMQLSTAIR